MQTNQLGKLPNFTPRQWDVIQLLVCGYTRKQMCEMLGMGYSTLDTHMRFIFAKTGLHSQIEVMQYAHDYGLAGIKQSPRITEGLNPSMLNKTEKTEVGHTVAEF